jgi:hypothetical protein
MTKIKLCTSYKKKTKTKKIPGRIWFNIRVEVADSLAVSSNIG